MTSVVRFMRINIENYHTESTHFIVKTIIEHMI